MLFCPKQLMRSLLCIQAAWPNRLLQGTAATILCCQIEAARSAAAPEQQRWAA